MAHLLSDCWWFSPLAARGKGVVRRQKRPPPSSQGELGDGQRGGTWETAQGPKAKKAAAELSQESRATARKRQGFLAKGFEWTRLVEKGFDGKGMKFVGKGKGELKRVVCG